MPDWHFAGTCAVGRVLDDSLQVLGVRGLYVCDMSVCRRPTTFNTAAMAHLLGIAFAERLARRHTTPAAAS